MRLPIALSYVTISLMNLSCLGGGGGGIAPLNGVSGSVESAQAANVVNLFQNALSTFSIDGTISPPQITGVYYGPTPLPLQENDPYKDCRKENPEVAEDQDDDGIAKLKEIEFNCQEVDDGVAYRSQIGKIKIEDMDDTKAGGPGGYDFEYDLKGISQYKDGGYYDFSYLGHFKYIIQDGSFVYDGNFETTNDGDSPSDGKYAYVYQQTWAYKVTPTDMEDPGLSGTVEMDGYYRILNESEDASLIPINVTMAVRSQNLTYDRTCSVYYRSGSMILKDSFGNEISINFTCDATSQSFNGQSL